MIVRILTVFLSIIFTLQINSQSFASLKSKVDSVNPVLGDISFISKYNKLPEFNTDENLRIRTHLEYVEKMLSDRNVEHLSPQLQYRRKQMLGLLNEYTSIGQFPVNYDYPGQRKPTFV